MINLFFSLQDHLKNKIQFEWNAAGVNDWPKIERLFIAAYVNAYKNCEQEMLALPHPILKEVEEHWQSCYEKAAQQGSHILEQEFINPLVRYFSHVDKWQSTEQKKPTKNNPFQEEIDKLAQHFKDKTIDISKIKKDLIKLSALVHSFKHEFAEEKPKFLNINKQNPYGVHYLVARFDDEPVAFFACQLNNKTGRLYFRWVTMSPAFHRQGLGKVMLDEVTKQFPQSKGMELYTRIVNFPVIKFYESSGFKPIKEFDYSEPTEIPPSLPKGYFTSYMKKWLEDKVLLGPLDDNASNVENFVGFRKNFKGSKMSPF